jgi:hypothetical protein
MQRGSGMIRFHGFIRFIGEESKDTAELCLSSEQVHHVDV